MTADDTIEFSAKVLGGLKEFQQRTAEYVFDRLYKAEDSTRRFLIADEVGLGKTLVAAGVTAQAIDHLMAANTPRIDVIYICSNQAIARQNVDRIKHSLSLETKPLAQRITLLPHRLDSLDQRINLIALTPGTSFNTASAEGIGEERVILFRMLTDAWGDLGSEARKVFLGGLRTVCRFKEYESWYLPREIDKSIVDQFSRAVAHRGGELHREFELVRDRLAEGLDPESRRQRQGFVSKLRRLPANSCLDALEPDLVILDEFQRFRDLLDSNTPSGELAQRLFEYEDINTKVRTLLLSATPYKMYTLSHESDEDHYRDFLRTVRFLEKNEESVEQLEESLRRFRGAIPYAFAEGEAGARALNLLLEHRDKIQSALLRVMSRTERRGCESGGDPMLQIEEMSVGLQVDDVEAHMRARAIAASVDAPGVMEYWKSAPYLLSFMDRYKLSERVRDKIESEPNGKVAELVKRGHGLKVEREVVEQRRSLEGGNGRMRAFLADLHDAHLHELLWLPSSLPEHTLGRDFERARPATKRLVFSSWAMVPRAVAVMASYDAERRYIPDAERAQRYEAQLLSVAGTSYSVFALLAPSATLSDTGDPLRHPDGKDAGGLLEGIQEQLRPKVEELIRGSPTQGPPHPIWYAVAPLLLDQHTPESIGWLQRPPAVSSTNASKEEGRESTAWQELTARVTQGLADPKSLGRPPGDLLEVLAALAAGSPANTTLRALSRITSRSPSEAELKGQAMRAAHAFRSFFRAPTSEGLLRNVYKPEVPGGRIEYWRRVLAYALEGGLTEFFHVIRESTGGEGPEVDLVDALCQSLRMAAGRLDVSEWKSDEHGVRRETLPMRQHFSRRYANDGQGGADLQANEHLDAVRAAFNSPFWPFVLGTTSIGQEGLDFHWYCHAVVHWNLPQNPVDLEQREGRVHRYHGHAIRKNIAQVVGSRALGAAKEAIKCDERLNPWDRVYRIAYEQFADDGGLVPHWVFTGGNARIQRHSPVLPLSRDAARVDALRRSLAVCRIVFGQPRQDDLLEFILREVPDDRRNLLATTLNIDLSPPM